MSSYFVLGLDTHAPVITWGDIEAADAGETLVVHYTIDEPAVISATVTLPDGTVLPMLVAADRLSAAIPGTARAGTATVAAVVEDDVLNTATRTLAFALGGVIPPHQVPGAGGMPRGRDFEPRVIRDVSQAGASSRDRIRAHVSSASSAQARSHYSGPTHRVVRSRSGASASSRIVNHESRSKDHGSTTVSAQPDVIRRREGPDHQAELVLLDIL